MNLIQSTNELSNPMVSIVIPSYNRDSTVGQTIDSILFQQCNFSLELIIGDDCSTDNARLVLLDYQRRYPDKISLIFHEKNIGLGANWATCVKAAKGNYICNCDNDDYWHNPEKLQLQVDFMESHPDENVLITNHRNHNRKTGVITEELAYIDRTMPLQQAIFKGHVRFCNATLMYRTEFLKNHLNLDDFIKYQFTLQDWNTWIILSAYTNFSIFPVSTATFGIETESITRPKTYESIINRFKNEKECYKYVCNLFPNDLPFDEKGYDSYVFSILINHAFKNLDFSSAQKFAIEMKNLGLNGSKIKLAQNPITFYALALLKRLKQNIND